MTKLIDLTGRTFGPPKDPDRVTVIRRAENAKNGHARWLCRCKCGNEFIAIRGSLTTGQTKSCGCYSRELASARMTKYERPSKAKLIELYSSKSLPQIAAYYSELWGAEIAHGIVRGWMKHYEIPCLSRSDGIRLRFKTDINFRARHAEKIKKAVAARAEKIKKGEIDLSNQLHAMHTKSARRKAVKTRLRNNEIRRAKERAAVAEPWED